MSGQAMIWAWDAPFPTAAMKLVALKLADGGLEWRQVEVPVSGLEARRAWRLVSRA